MQNKEVKELEDKVIALKKDILNFLPDLCTRSKDNYNYLGTLDSNLKCLRTVIDILTATLKY